MSVNIYFFRKNVKLSEANRFKTVTAHDIISHNQFTTFNSSWQQCFFRRNGATKRTDGEPIFHTFTKLEPFADFAMKAMQFITTTLKEEWIKNIDYLIFETEK